MRRYSRYDTYHSDLVPLESVTSSLHDLILYLMAALNSSESGGLVRSVPGHGTVLYCTIHT